MSIRDSLNDAQKLVETLKQAVSILDTLSKGTSPESIHNSKLTPTQQKVYALFKDGHDADSIAETLDIRKKTVDVHRAEIQRRLGFKKAKDFYKSLRPQ